MLSGGFQGLSGGPEINATGYFQQRPIMYVMSPFPFLHKYTHFQDITPRFFSFFRITIQFAA
jgi:hypothetical protein